MGGWGYAINSYYTKEPLSPANNIIRVEDSNLRKWFYSHALVEVGSMNLFIVLEKVCSLDWRVSTALAFY